MAVSITAVAVVPVIILKPVKTTLKLLKHLSYSISTLTHRIENVSYDRFTYKDPSQNELYFEIQTETRDFAGWDSVEGTHDDGDYDSDYHQSDEGDVGYAFYIQD
jgi:hypothetical protein